MCRDDNDFLVKSGRFESSLDLCLFVIFVDLAHRLKQATKDENEFNSTKACSFMIIHDCLFYDLGGGNSNIFKNVHPENC